MSRRGALVLLALLLVAVLGGVAGYVASTAPDGLARVASETGIASTESGSPAAGGVLSYQTPLASGVGVAVTFAAITSLLWATRRRWRR